MFRHLSCIFLSTAILLHNIIPTTCQIDVEGPVFAEECYANVVAADTDNNGRLTQSEYLLFAQLQGPPGIIDDVTSFANLPPDYRAAFTALACFCADPVFGGSPDTPTCCVSDQTIRVPEGPGDTQSDEDLRMLFAICALTDSAARKTLNTDQPTSSPSAITSAPTTVPTNSPVAPTGFPTTVPTLLPTGVPTQTPTQTPTVAPTSGPTSTPTIAPTTETATPTVSPTLGPTNFPTTSSAPSHRPTLTPTNKPTLSPGPTVAPITVPPSIAPTGTPTVTPIQIQTLVNYSVAFLDGQTAGNLADYYSDLVVAMDQLSDNLAADIWGQRRLQGTLSIRAMRPTRIREETTIGRFFYELTISCFALLP